MSLNILSQGLAFDLRTVAPFLRNGTAPSDEILASGETLRTAWEAVQKSKHKICVVHTTSPEPFCGAFPSIGVSEAGATMREATSLRGMIREGCNFVAVIFTAEQQVGSGTTHFIQEDALKAMDQIFRVLDDTCVNFGIFALLPDGNAMNLLPPQMIGGIELMIREGMFTHGYTFFPVQTYGRPNPPYQAPQAPSAAQDQ